MSTYNQKLGVFKWMAMAYDFKKQAEFLLFQYINFLIYWDLWRMIRNPFYPQRKRLFRYQITGTALVLIMFFVLLACSVFEKNMPILNFVIFGPINSIFFIGALIMMFLILMDLREIGSNRDLKLKIAFRYMLVCLFVFPLTAYHLWHCTQFKSDEITVRILNFVTD